MMMARKVACDVTGRRVKGKGTCRTHQISNVLSKQGWRVLVVGQSCHIATACAIRSTSF